jgi:predicted secreted Zn-dependent protease
LELVRRCAVLFLPSLLACNLLTAVAPTPTPIPTLTPVATPAPSVTPVPISTTESATATPTSPPAPVRTRSTTVTEETSGSVTLRATRTLILYEINGFSEIDLEGQMRTLGPTDSAGGFHWYALTEPFFDWQHEALCNEAGCVASHVTMLLTVNTTLPRWGSSEGATQELQGKWAAFSGALSGHEEGHTQRAVNCAWRLGEAFAALPPAPNDQALSQSMRAASDPIFAECRATQRTYENETDHGRTQGVVWPPY